MLSDQPRNAARIAALGAGVTVPPGQRTPAQLQETLARVLENPSYAAAAQRVAAEIATLPPVDDAVEFLQRQVR